MESWTCLAEVRFDVTFIFIDISDTQSNAIFKAIKQTPVKHIILSNNKLTDAAVLQILSAIPASTVEVLNLANNKISEKCAEDIAYKLKIAKSLR